VYSATFLLSIISLIIWVLLAFFRGGFWQLSAFDDDVLPHKELTSRPRVVAIVPARNEAETIARAVQSLAAQHYAGDLRICVVDDHSEDGTADAVRKANGSIPVERRATTLQADSLPPGWTGKIWALQQGVAKTNGVAPDYYWFTDADIVHAPDTLQRLVSRAEAEQRDLVSLMVLLHAKSFAERLLIPAFVYFFLKLYVPRWISDPKSRTAGAAGGCVLLRATALKRIGGLVAIRGEVIDDCALARAVKGSGGTIWIGLTVKSVSLRTYTTFGEIRDMIARTAFTQLDYSPWLLLGTLLGMLLTYLVPVALALQSRPPGWQIALGAWVLMTLTYLPTVRFYRLSPLWATFLPIAAAFYSYATWLSAVRHWMGRGGQWKGRSQAPAIR
jgi:hopene-associated glycosyltransferase HpnB